MPVGTAEIETLAQGRGGSQVTALHDGSVVVHVPGVSLPAGWSKDATHVRWLVSPGYPAAMPDCFFADADLRIAGGSMPANSGLQELNGTTLLWFSWHLQSWRPGRDDLLCYLRFIERRFADVR